MKSKAVDLIAECVGPFDRSSDRTPKELAFQILSLKGIENGLLLRYVPVVWDDENQVAIEGWIKLS
ncbi:MAG: hypothetical protein ACK6DC_18260 [Planctomycetota bacterium]